MSTRTTNIFCIIANAGSDQELYLSNILSDKHFLKQTKLSRLIYNTTKPKDNSKKESDNVIEKYIHITTEEFNAIPEELIIDSRSYYTLPYGTIYYFTLISDIANKGNLICITSPYQFENYKRWISIENFRTPNSYNIFAILIHCKLKDRFINKLNNDKIEDQDLLEFSRRVLQDNAEFKDAQLRIPELDDPMNCNNVCFITNEPDQKSDFKVNIEQIKGFILDKVKNNQICYL